jgi:hypothetical protein
MARTQTETGNETRAWGAVQRADMILGALSQVSVAEDRRFELLRACPQNAFQTMRTSVHRRPPPSATSPDTTRAVTRERRRTQVNDTETETGGQAALDGAARRRSGAR